MASETGYRLSPAPLAPQPIEENHDEFKDDPAPAFASGGFDVDSFTRDNLHCPSCGKYYDDPRTLPCLDSYCRECLKKEAREQKEKREREREREAREREGNGQMEEEDDDPDQNYLETLRSSYNITPSSTGGLTNEHSDPLSDNFDCPQGCQCPTGIKFDRDGDIDHIPPSNKFLANMVEDVRLKNEVPAGKVLCGYCEDGEVAIAVCNNPECANLPLCSDCLRYHLKKSKKRKEHRIVYPNPEMIGDSNGSEGENHFPTWKNFIRHNWPCNDHPDHFVDRYCYEHKETICRDCAALSSCHRNCAKVELTMDVMDEEIVTMTELIDRVNAINNKVKKGIKEIETMIVSLTHNKGCILREITEYYGRLITTLEQQREEMTNQTRQVYETKTANLEEHQDGLKRISDTLQRSIDFIGGSVNMAIPTEFMFLKESFHERLNYLNKRYKDSSKLPSDLNDRIHVELKDDFNVEGALGQVVGTPFIENYTLESFPRVVHARRCYSFQVQSRDICKTPVAGSVPILKATICLVGLEPTDCNVKLKDEEGVYTITFKAERAGRHKICVFCPQTCPLDDLLVKGCPFYIDVRQ